VKAVLDTDIGSNIDDLLCLAFLLASPEVELAGVTIAGTDPLKRAALAGMVLRAAERPGVPVAAGASRPLNPLRDESWPVFSGHGQPFPSQPPELIDPRSAPSFLLDLCGRYGRELCILAVGPLTNVAKLARDHPRVLQGIGGVWVMGGCLAAPGVRSIRPETNFRCDPEAAAEVLSCGASIWVVGLNVTLQTSFSRDVAQRLADVPSEMGRLLGRAAVHFLAEKGRESTPAHDVLAAAALVGPDLLEWDNLAGVVQTHGAESGVVTWVRPDSVGLGVRVARSVNVNAFQTLFSRRIAALAGETWT